MSDKEIISIIATYVGLGIAVLFIPIVWRERKRLDERLSAFWAMSWCIGLGSLVYTDSIYLLIGRISHVPNLNWLIVCWFVVAAVYCIMVIMSRTLKITPATLKATAYL